MASSAAFDWVCGELERTSTLSDIEARGTVRLALKNAGLDASSVAAADLRVVIDRVLAGELDARGIDGKQVCAQLSAGLATSGLGEGAGIPQDSPESVFQRLGTTTGPTV